MKTSFRSCFKLGTHPQCYGFMITPSKYLEHFPSTQQNENEIAYERKANENLLKKKAILNCFQSENKQATNKFFNVQNHKKSYSTTTFRIILLFR